jgi:hypothetical protein
MPEIILSGTEETLKPIITLLVGVSQLIESKDIGQFVGEPLIANVQALPHTSRLKLILCNVKAPPFVAPPGGKLIKAEYQIPDIKPTKITWQGMKDTCGGTNGFIWGNWLATANLDNGRQMQAYGGNAMEAENMLDRMLLLTTAESLSRSCTELKKTGRRAKGQGLYREPTRLYPLYFHVINSKRIAKIENRRVAEEKRTNKRSKLRGDYIELGTERIPLYTAKPPANFAEIMRRALDFGKIEDD